MTDNIHRKFDLNTLAPLAKKILLITGEESGDVYAGRIIGHIKQMIPGVAIDGIGGPRSREAGMETFYDISQMSSVGIASMLGRLGFFLRVLDEIKERVSSGDYDAVILIDYPDFNMRVAEAADGAGIPVFYYVCPQFWAWRRYRLKAVKKYIDMMLVVFPFEEEFYIKRGINAQFVGHPLLDELEEIMDRDALRHQFGANEEHTLLGLLPGSRHGEIKRMLSQMLQAVKLIDSKIPVKVVIACSKSIEPKFLQDILKDSGVKALVVHDRSWEVMRACDYLICKSGTSTLQAALAGCPMQIVYRSDLVSYVLAKSLAHLKYAGLPNLLADRELVPELLQWNMTPKAMSDVALDYLSDPEKMRIMKEDLDALASTLGEGGASKRAANKIINYLKKLKSI